MIGTGILLFFLLFNSIQALWCTIVARLEMERSIFLGLIVFFPPLYFAKCVSGESSRQILISIETENERDAKQKQTH